MAKVQSLQDPFLNALRKEHIVVSIYLVNGIKLQGQVESFGEGILKGISSITLPAKVYKEENAVPATLKLIPYYAWNNRGDNVTMNVWFARDLGTAIESTVHTVGNVSDVSATHTNLEVQIE